MCNTAAFPKKKKNNVSLRQLSVYIRWDDETMSRAHLMGANLNWVLDIKCFATINNYYIVQRKTRSGINVIITRNRLQTTTRTFSSSTLNFRGSKKKFTAPFVSGKQKQKPTHNIHTKILRTKKSIRSTESWNVTWCIYT